MKLHIMQVGKTKDAALQQLLDEYTRRMGRTFQLQVETVKDEGRLWERVSSELYTVVLEAHGKAVDSSTFAKLFHDLPLRGVSDVQILIGPAEGFAEYRRQPDLILSLSPMTFSHQTVRLLLYEQLYRAATVLEGKPFAK